jgi:Peptidase C39 family
MNLTIQESNAFKAIENLVKINQIKVTSTSLKNALLCHSKFPSLIAFTDVLDEFSIPNLAVRILPDQLHQIPLPALAYFEHQSWNTFVTILQITENSITWQHNEDGIRTESILSFTQKWRGIALLVEPDLNSGETNYSSMRKQEILESLRIPFIAFGLLICLGFVMYPILKHYSFIENWPYYALLLTKTIGVISSVLLILNNIHSNNTILQKTRSTSKRINHSNIFISKGSKFGGLVTSLELGLFYFAGGLFTLLIAPKFSHYGLGGLSVFPLCYSIWLIYCQIFTNKGWDPLCVTLEVLVWIEFFIFLNGNAINFDLRNITVGGWMVTPILYVIIKKHLQKSSQTDIFKNEFQKIRFSPKYVQSVLSEESTLPPIFEGIKTIEMGSDSAEYMVLLILSPDCILSRDCYLQAKKLIEKDVNFRATIIFTPLFSPNDYGDKVAEKVLSQAPENMLFTLDNWYNGEAKNLTKMVIQPEATEEYKQQLTAQLRWLELALIRETPSMFLNNAQLPKHYAVSEIPKLVKIRFSNLEQNE